MAAHDDVRVLVAPDLNDALDELGVCEAVVDDENDARLVRLVFGGVVGVDFLLELRLLAVQRVEYRLRLPVRFVVQAVQPVAEVVDVLVGDFVEQINV